MLVIVSPSLCDAAVVFLTPLVTPVKVLLVIPVYDISSVPIKIKFVPVLGNCDASVNTIGVVELLIAPFKVVVVERGSARPRVPNDQPKPLD